MLSLPENFESYNQARKNGFLKMKELKEAGQRIVGTFCSFVPTELVEPLFPCAPAARNQSPLPKRTCPETSAH